MDINDPRRRLRVLNQSSPSLRVAAQPKINITTAQPKQPRLFVGNTQIKPNETARAGGPVYNPERTDQRNNVEKFGDLIGFQPFAEGISQLIGGTTSRENEDSLQKSMQNAELLKQYNNSFRTGKLSKEAYDRAVSNVAKENNAIVGDVRETSGKLDRSKFLASAGIVGSTPFALSGFGAKTLAGKVAAEAGIGASQGALNELAANEDPSVANVAKTAGIGAALGGILPAFGAGVSRVMSKLRGGEEGALNRLASKLATTEDTGQIIDEVIKSAPDADPARSAEVARFISTTDDPDAIRAALDELKAPGVVDATGPVNTDEVVQQVQEPDVRFTESSLNSKQAVKNPAIAKYATGESKDSLTTLINAFVKMDNPSEVRSVISDLLPDLSTGQQKRLAQKLAQVDNEDDVAKILTGADDIRPAVKLNQEELTANTQKITDAEPVAQSEKVQDVVEELPKPAVNTDAVETPVAPVADEQLGETVAKNADEAAQKYEQSAEALFPAASPEDKAEIQKVMDSLEEAKTKYSEVTTDFSKRRGAALYRGDKKAQEVGGVAGYRERLKSLKNVKKDNSFEPIDVSDGFKDRVVTSIQKNDKLLPGEKTNRETAVLKLFGEVDGIPTEREQKLIREVLGDDVANLVDEAIEQAKQGMTTQDIIEQLAGAPRTIMTIGDASAPRQLAVSFSRHPVITTKEYLKSFKDMFSGERFAARNKEMLDMVDSKGKKYSEFMETDMNLHFSNVAEEAGEESMSSAPLLSKVPFVGKVIEGSNRGMSSATSWTRFNIAKKFIDDAGGVEEAAKTFSKSEFEELGEVLNTITGRGGKKGGFTDRHATILSKTLFSGKLWASRMNMLNPYWYYRLSGPARKEALTSAASFAASAGVVLTLIDQIPGVEVGTNPTSADFAKIKVGNTRFDILGGFQQNIRVASQIIAGKRTNSDTGEEKPTSAASVIGGLFEGKANPLMGYAYRMLNTLDDPNNDNPLVRLDEWGQEVNVAKETGKLVVPLPVSGVKETVDDQGGLKGTLMSIPGFFGAGVQTYGGTKTKETGKNGEYTGEVKDNMVTDANGKVMLDDKGKPITVKFEDGATDLEKKVLLDNARDTAMAAEYRKNLSTEDQALLKLNKDELKEYLDRGDITKEKYNQLEQYEQDIRNLDGVDIPDTLKSDVAKNFYRTYNSMTKARQEEWLKGDADDNSKAITKQLNKERPKGLPEYKPSNELAKMYADLEDKINGEKLSTLKKEDAIKDFHGAATKLNYSKAQNEIYSSTIGQLRSLLDRKKLAKKDMDKAVELDNYLYNAGLRSYMKFSKKFRGEYGYSLPSGPKGGSGSGYASGGGRSGGTGGSSGGTQRGYLSALLPSFSTSTKSSKPTISSVSRPIKFASSVKKSGGKGTKKATIKL